MNSSAEFEPTQSKDPVFGGSKDKESFSDDLLQNTPLGIASNFTDIHLLSNQVTSAALSRDAEGRTAAGKGVHLLSNGDTGTKQSTHEQATDKASLPTPSASQQNRLSSATSPATPERSAGPERTSPSRADLHRRKINEILRQLTNMQSATRSTRLILQQARTGLRQNRKIMTELDANFLRELRILLLAQPREDVERLLRLCEELQKYHDEFLPEEDNYNTLEKRLMQDDFDLQEALNDLVPYVVEHGPRFLREPSILSQESYYNNQTAEIVPAVTESSRPQPTKLTEYLSRVGDLDLIRESLNDLRRERAHLVAEAHMRSRVKLELGKESRAFLDSFNVRHEELLREMDVVSAEVDRLRSSLIDLGLEDYTIVQTSPFDERSHILSPSATTSEHENPSLQIFEDGMSDTSLATSPPPSPRAILSVFQFPRSDPLLLAADDWSRVFPIPEEGEAGTITPLELVEDWMADTLRRSSLAVMRFRSEDRSSNHPPLRNNFGHPQNEDANTFIRDFAGSGKPASRDIAFSILSPSFSALLHRFRGAWSDFGSHATLDASTNLHSNSALMKTNHILSIMSYRRQDLKA
jgi:hypothetical protein